MAKMRPIYMPRTLPVILSRDEVDRLIMAATNLKHRTALPVATTADRYLSVTLVPVLMSYLIRGQIPHENSNPINRVFVVLYRPLLEATLQRPWVPIGLAVVALAITLIPVARLEGEFMPPLDEGDLLYMPTALPGISADKAAE